LLQTRGIAAPAVSTILKITRSDRRSIAGAASAFGDHAHSPPINSWGAANLATARWRFGILALITAQTPARFTAQRREDRRSSHSARG
jgi:hypothetical protein